MHMRRLRSAVLIILAIILLEASCLAAEGNGEKAFTHQSALKAAWELITEQYRQPVKSRHRVFLMEDGTSLVLINFKADDEKDLIHAAVCLASDGTVEWAVLDQKIINRDPVIFQTFYLTKRGECYHRRIRCSKMKEPFYLPDFAVPMVRSFLRPCKRCSPRYNAR